MLSQCVAKEKEVSGEDVAMSGKCPYGEGSEWGRCSDEREVSIWRRASLEMMGRTENRLN